MNMKKNMIRIIMANIFYMVVVAATNFILPKFTSIETYAAVKEYTLYLTTYSTILTFGYIQGMYVKYGGKTIEELSVREISENLFSFFVLLLPSSIIVTTIGIVMGNVVLTCLGIGLTTTNLCSYFQLFYQATGDFKTYGIALNFSRVAMLVAYCILIFAVRTDSISLYVWMGPLIGVISVVYLTYKLNKRIPLLKNFRFSIKAVKRNTSSGFVLMLGDFVTKFFSSIDKWFVNILMTTFDFAMYSFAVSMENLVNTFMTPITVSMFNYFCKGASVEEIKKIKNSALIYAFVIIAGAYPAKWILENFMQEYISSTVVIFPLFAAQGIGTIIKGIYVNKYKAENKQKKYLRQMIIMFILSVALDALVYYLFRSIAAIAVATLIVNTVWFIICELQNKEIRYGIREFVTIICLLIVYMVTGFCVGSILGCVIYCACGLLLGLTLMRKSFLFVVNSMLLGVKDRLGALKK